MGGKVDALRRIKTAEEIEYLAQAEHIGDVAFSRILDFLKPGVSELEVAAELEYQMKKAGAEDLGFNTIIASGLNSSMPHAIPGRKKLEAGDFVTMDFGCKYEGYCSDMTRTVVIGKANDKQKEIYNVVLEAQLAGLAAVKAGKQVRKWIRPPEISLQKLVTVTVLVTVLVTVWVCLFMRNQDLLRLMKLCCRQV